MIRRFLGWAAINAGFATLFVYALRTGHSGATNVVVAIAWITALGALTILGVVQAKPSNTMPAEKIIKTITRFGNEPWWFRLMDAVYDLAFLAAFMWFGWWWTFVGYLLHAILYYRMKLVARIKYTKINSIGYKIGLIHTV